jgi:hypothetical protein
MEETGLHRLAEGWGWKGAIRNDGAIAGMLQRGQAVDAVYNIDAGTLADTFFHWLDVSGALNPLRTLEPRGVKRRVVDFESLLLTYFMRCVCRVPSMNSLPQLLFADKGLMRRLGFNAHQLKHGLTQRGVGRSGPRRNVPLDPEMLAKQIGALDAEELHRGVRQGLRQIWQTVARPPRQVLGIIDGTLIEMGSSAEGGAWTKRSKKIRTKEGLKSVEVAIYGYLLVWACEASTGLPLAFAFGKANDDERQFVGQLLDDAQEVLAGISQLDVVVLDRGFFDGPGLDELDRRGLRFVIPARRDSNVFAEAHEQAHAAHPALARYSARRKTPDELLEVAGIEGLRCFETYAPARQVHRGGHVDRHKKSFEPKRINAVVLTQHSGYPDADLVLLTNGQVRKPFQAYDDYDARSLIENKNRTLKQDFKLCKPPQRRFRAAEIHSLFVILAYACATGHMLYLDAQQELIRANKPCTLGEYLRQLALENRDQLIIFEGSMYGIFFSCELLLLQGIHVKEPDPRAATSCEEILQRSGFDRPKPT